MPYCKNCGTFLSEDKLYCDNCGTPVNENSKEKFKKKLDDMTNMEDHTSSYSTEDIKANKVFAILSYIGFLCLVPIIAAKNSPYARFHANQGLVLFALELITSAVSWVLGWIFVFIIPLKLILSLVFTVIDCIIVVLAVLGIINAATDKAKKLPIIGGITLIK